MGFFAKSADGFDPLFAERGLSLERMRSFLVVADAGGIARAAAGDPVRQSQLSRQLSELEGFFGCALTERREGRRVLTPAGARLAEHVRWSLAGLLEIKGSEAAGPGPPFALAAGDSVLHWLVLPRIAAVDARFSVRALPAHAVVGGLVDGSVELGIVRRDETSTSLESAPIGKVDHALFVPRSLAPRGVSDDELPFRVRVAAQVSDCDFIAKMVEAATKAGRTLSVSLACETFPQVFRAVQSGAYAGLLPTFARAELGPTRFKEISFGGPYAYALRLAWSPSLLRTRPSARPVIERLADVLRAKGS